MHIKGLEINSISSPFMLVMMLFLRNRVSCEHGAGSVRMLVSEINFLGEILFVQEKTIG